MTSDYCGIVRLSFSLIAVSIGASSIHGEVELPRLPALKPDPTIRSTVEKSLRVNYILRDDVDPTLVQVMIQVDRPPTGMGFDVALHAGGRAWPIGPVAWSKGKIAAWAYDVDLPQEIETVDVILAPSATAVVKLLKRKPQDLVGIKEIWTGESIVLPGVKVSSQHVGMVTIPPPRVNLAREAAIEEMVGADAGVLQLVRDNEISEARKSLQNTLLQHPGDLNTLYNLGCLAAADFEWLEAVAYFAKVRDLDRSSALADDAQRQLRRICSISLYSAERDVKAMFRLGTCFERGWGPKANAQEAKRWYRNAANAGHTEGMCRLAAMYEHETGAAQHTAEAHEWYRSQTREWYQKAADSGSAEARQWLSSHANR